MAADCGGVFLICTHGLPSPHAIFAIASMTKAITTTAAMQLVERGSLQLDEPVHTHLPELRGLPVLEDFDDAGNPRFSADRHQVTLRQLLTHTAGFAYNWNHPLVLRHGPGQPPFLVHRPGARWHYGTNIDWVGKLVEAAGGLSLEAYFQQHILQPLEMNDTSFLLPSQKLDRLVSTHQRGTDGALIEAPRAQPPAPPFFNGGGGLFSTAGDYIRFTQMILRRGLAANGMRILSEASILEMSSNQTNDLPVGRIRTTIPERSCNVDFHPGAIDRFGLGFLINPEPHHGGRSAGSLAWGGIRNTFYWVDPRRGIAAVLLMQFQPFCDPAAIGMLNDFERSVYQTL
jgi:CubicO group peptidase (beta-lactamase class C family)